MASILLKVKDLKDGVGPSVKWPFLFKKEIPMTTLESLSKLDQKTILAATMYSSMETLGEPKTDAFLETPFDLLDDCFGDSSVQVNGSLTLGLHLGVNLAKLGYIDEIENPKAGGSKAKVVVPAADHS